MTKTIPTVDTPQEREDKAITLARQLKRFQWEIRFYYIILFVLVATGVIGK